MNHTISVTILTSTVTRTKEPGEEVDLSASFSANPDLISLGQNFLTWETEIISMP
jgi:hypothetical protein